MRGHWATRSGEGTRNGGRAARNVGRVCALCAKWSGVCGPGEREPLLQSRAAACMCGERTEGTHSPRNVAVRARAPHMERCPPAIAVGPLRSGAHTGPALPPSCAPAGQGSQGDLVTR